MPNMPKSLQLLKLLKLLQLSSPTLPVGAFAYSQGLESAVETGLIIDAETTQHCLEDSLRYSLQPTDVPLFSRLYQAWRDNDREQVNHWNQFLQAQRETKELRAEDHQLGIALARLLFDLGITEAQAWKKNPKTCFLTLFTLAAVKWNISLEEACTGYLWSWLDNQIVAAIKLVPLGQTDGQKVLSNTIELIPDIIRKGLLIKTAEIGASLPMLAILSAQHETQYSRLFRS